jgi:hypothetical protein
MLSGSVLADAMKQFVPVQSVQTPKKSGPNVDVVNAFAL